MGQRIKALEKDFVPALTAIEKADLILFSYPVYTFIAPYQLHRFIELLKASGVSFEGRFVSQITTSKHFYDSWCGFRVRYCSMNNSGLSKVRKIYGGLACIF